MATSSRCVARSGLHVRSARKLAEFNQVAAGYATIGLPAPALVAGAAIAADAAVVGSSAFAPRLAGALCAVVGAVGFPLANRARRAGVGCGCFGARRASAGAWQAGLRNGCLLALGAALAVVPSNGEAGSGVATVIGIAIAVGAACVWLRTPLVSRAHALADTASRRHHQRQLGVDRPAPPWLGAASGRWTVVLIDADDDLVGVAREHCARVGMTAVTAPPRARGAMRNTSVVISPRGRVVACAQLRDTVYCSLFLDRASRLFWPRPAGAAQQLISEPVV